jgi:hypothetical protein
MNAFRFPVALSAIAALFFPHSAAPAPARRGPVRGNATRLVRLTPASGHSRKPEAPVTIRLVPGPVRGNRQAARLLVTPLADGERLDIVVTAVEGLAVVNGNGRWSTPVRRGAAFATDLFLTAAADPSGRGEQRLIVTATLVFPGDQAENPSQTAVASWAARPRQVSLLEAHPGSRRVKGPNGRRILEIPGDAP